MSDYLRDILSTGRKFITDTKTPRKPPTKAEEKPGKPLRSPAAGSGPETDPHKIFVKRMSKEKPKKMEVMKEIQKFCDEADSHL
jgi:hypothetical protein